MGVWDPYGILKPGEVFIQFAEDISINSKCRYFDYLKGNLLVTRSPTVHPGDIRKLNAVDWPELSHIVNVIVFSTQGFRPEQDKMSTGDLDGDEYWIWWRKEIVEQFTESQPDGESSIFDLFGKINLFDNAFTAFDRKEETNCTNIIDTEILREDWIINFIEFMKNDKLGVVADLHAQIADSGPDMIKCEGRLLCSIF